MQQPGAAAVGKGLLRNQLFREIEIEVGNQHWLDYRASKAYRSCVSLCRRFAPHCDNSAFAKCKSAEARELIFEFSS
jgi:hypothetical protein